MKKQNGLPRFKVLPRRTRYIILALIGAILCVSCGSPPVSSNDKEGTTKVAGIETLAPTSTVVEVQPTKTLIPTATTAPSFTPTATTAPSFTPTATTAPSITPTATASPTPTIQASPTENLPAFYVADCLPKNTPFQKGTVVEVIDGDTVDVRLEDGTTARVGYIGMDSPEVERPLHEEAGKANSDLVQNKEVILIKDVSETDAFDRLLRYVIVGDVFVNLEMVKQGLAVAEDYPPDSACSSTLTSAMNVSRSSQIGMWQPTPIPEPSGPVIVIISVNKDAEVVEIQNQGTIEVNLSGWNLVSEKGNQGCPLSGVLKAGETLQIWAMQAQGTGYSCGHAKTIWNNSELDPAVLYNPEGVEVDRW